MTVLKPALLGLAVALGMPSTAALAEPPPWAPAHGYREKQKHRYVYYPAHQIYYAPERELWFWLDSGQWQFGVNLPVVYQQYTTRGVTVELDVARPFERHRHVVEHYGRPDRGEREYEHEYEYERDGGKYKEKHKYKEKRGRSDD